MKKTFKIGFIYLGVILLAVLATIIFCGAFLFFYREGDIFGVKYISRNEVVYAMEKKDISDVKTIDVSSSGFDISVEINKRVDTLVGAMRIKAFGYTTKSRAQADFSLTYNNSTKTATFKSKEPTGWLNKKGSYITISIPDEWTNSNYNLVIKTKKGDVVINGGTYLSCNDISVDSTKGDLSIKATNITSNISLNCGKGTFYLDEKCTTDEGVAAKLSVNSGKINLTHINMDKFKFESVEVLKNTKGEISIIALDSLITNGNIEGGGDVKVGKVNTVNFSSRDTDLTILEINGPSRIVSSGAGDVYIKESFADVEVDAYNGDVELIFATGLVIATTNQGNIKISNAIKLVSAESMYGDIEISFDENAPNYSTSDTNRAVKVSTKDGKVVVRGLQNGTVLASDSGRIELYYNKVIGENKIISNMGTVYVVVPAAPTETSRGYELNLKVISDVGADVKVGVGGSIKYDSESSNQEYNNIYGNTSINNLVIESVTGKIKVRSSDVTEF